MPCIENVWLPFNTLHKVSASTASVGSLFYRFDGDLTMIAIRPGAAGSIPLKVAINLETFAGTPVTNDLDETIEGVETAYRFEVDPMSAYPASPDAFGAGDLLTNGNYVGLVVCSPTGKPIALTLIPSLEGAPIIGYRGWRILVGDKIVYARPCLT